MGGRLGHHLPAHGHAAGEEDVVEGLLQQALVLLPPALHHGGVLRGEGLPDEGGQHSGGMGGVGGGFYHRAVPRRQGPDEGLQGEEDRVVPGGEDEYHPVGLRQNGAPAGELGQGGENRPPAAPALHMPAHIAQLGQGEADLAQKRLHPGLAQVSLEGLVQVLLVVQNGLFQPVQGLDAGLDREGPAGEKVGSLLFQQGLNRLFGGHSAPPSNSFPSILPQIKRKVKENSAGTAV